MPIWKIVHGYSAVKREQKRPDGRNTQNNEELCPMDRKRRLSVFNWSRDTYTLKCILYFGEIELAFYIN